MTARADALGLPFHQTQPPANPGFAAAGAAIAQILSTGTGTLKITTVGDSLTEGFSASSYANRYPTKLAEKLRAKLGLPSKPNSRFHSSDYTAALGQSWTYTGTTNSNASFGMGFRSRGMSAGSTATLNFTGTDVDLFLLGAFSLGNTQYTIDGGAPVPVTTTLTGSDVRTIRVEIRGLAPGAHTLVVSPTGATNIVLEGAYVYDGDLTTGVHIHEAGHAGFRYEDFNNYHTFNGGTCHFRQGNHLAIVELGGNDWLLNGNTISAAQFADRMRRQYSGIRCIRPDLSIVMCVFYETPRSSPVSPWSAWRDAYFSVSREHNLLSVDFANSIGSFASPGNPYDVGDQVHPNDAGMEVIAQQVADSIINSAGYSQSAFVSQATATEAKHNSPNLLTTTDLSLWSQSATPIVTATGNFIDAHPTYTVQDNNGGAFEGIYVAMPTMLANRRYRMTIQFNHQNIVTVSGPITTLMGLYDTASFANGLFFQDTNTTLTGQLLSTGSAATLGITSFTAAAGMKRTSPFNANYWELSLEFTIGASNLLSSIFALFPSAAAAGRQGTVEFGRPSLQLIG